MAPAEKTKQEMRSEKQGGPDHMEPCVPGSQVLQTDSLCICGRLHRWLQSAEKNKQGARAEDPRLVKTSNGPRGQKKGVMDRRDTEVTGQRKHTATYQVLKQCWGCVFWLSPPGSSLSSETASSSKMIQEPKCMFRQG